MPIQPVTHASVHSINSLPTMYKNQQQQKKPELEHPTGMAGLRRVVLASGPPSDQIDPPRYSAIMKVSFSPTIHLSLHLKDHLLQPDPPGCVRSLMACF